MLRTQDNHFPIGIPEYTVNGELVNVIAFKNALDAKPAELSESLAMLYASGQLVYDKLIADTQNAELYKAEIAYYCTEVLKNPYDPTVHEELDKFIDQTRIHIRNDILSGMFFCFLAIAALTGAICIAIFVPPLAIFTALAATILNAIQLTIAGLGCAAVTGFGAYIFSECRHKYGLHSEVRKFAECEVANDVRSKTISHGKFTTKSI